MNAADKFTLRQVGNLPPTLAMTLPRRRVFVIAARIWLEGFRAYWHRSPTVTFWIGEDR